jgi:hypothetical protein
VQLSAGLILSTKDKKTAVRLQAGGLTEEEAEDGEFKSGGRRTSSSSTGVQSAATQQQAQQQQREEEQEPVLGEPQTFYRLPDGTWWLEFCRFYTAAQAEAASEAAAAATAQQGSERAALALPHGFDRGCELLKAVERRHAPMSDIAGASMLL